MNNLGLRVLESVILLSSAALGLNSFAPDKSRYICLCNAVTDLVSAVVASQPSVASRLLLPKNLGPS